VIGRRFAIVVSSRRPGLALPIIVVLAAACAKPPTETLRLERNMLTVTNQSPADWTNVEIWINRQYRLTAPKIGAGARLQAPLDVFVAGYGQRFDFHRTQITDLRLTAEGPDGARIEMKKDFEASGLAGVGSAFGGKR
jgi:hypothetical protein